MDIILDKKLKVIFPLTTTCCKEVICVGSIILPVFIIKEDVYKVIDLNTSIGHDILKDKLILSTEVLDA